MINFFRKIRKKLANDNQFGRYFRYAFGEVALIMLGIFMALQLQNWNEKRKEQKQFHVVLEQIYNAIFYDVDKFKNQYEYMDFQIRRLDFILDYPDSIPKESLPYTLYGTGFDNFKSYQSDAFFYINDLSSDYNNLERNDLVKQITGYLNLINNSNNRIYEVNNNMLADFLISKGLAFPQLDRKDFNAGWDRNSPNYYPDEVLEQLQKDIKTNEYRAVIKTYLSQKIGYQRGAIGRYQQGKSILNAIKEYYPQVRVIYEKVGIIGTSLEGYDDVGAFSTPMNRIDKKNSVWEAELYLKEGTVKFRCNDSWLRNWGGIYGDTTFPAGAAMPDGDNIPIEVAGTYHIKLDLSTYTYEFTRIVK